MDIGFIIKAWLMSIVQSKWGPVLDGLKKAKFCVQDPATGTWYVKFPCGTTPESFGEAVAAFLRKLLALVKAAAK
jgi:hypothetical protein